MKKQRWHNRPEIWFNESKNIIVMRSSEFLFEALYLNDFENYWKKHAFKKSFSFDFFNGSNYLRKNGFKLIERFYE